MNCVAVYQLLLTVVMSCLSGFHWSLPCCLSTSICMLSCSLSTSGISFMCSFHQECRMFQKWSIFILYIILLLCALLFPQFRSFSSCYSLWKVHEIVLPKLWMCPRFYCSWLSSPHDYMCIYNSLGFLFIQLPFDVVTFQLPCFSEHYLSLFVVVLESLLFFFFFFWS